MHLSWLRCSSWCRWSSSIVYCHKAIKLASHMGPLYKGFHVGKNARHMQPESLEWSICKMLYVAES